MSVRHSGALGSLLLALVGCHGSGLEPYGAGAPTDPAVSPSSPTTPTASGPTTPGSPGEGTAPTTPTAGTGTGTEAPPPPPPLRFLVLGDGGRGNDAQYRVADGMERICAAHGCDFALYVGDNIYDAGVDSVDDAQFEEKFELPYANLKFPFYMALGNHDHGGDVDAQVAYTARSPRWRMPARWYTHVQGDATFFALDTDALSGGELAAQEEWIERELAKVTTTWKFAFGHHPYLSNGEHGNTGGDLAAFTEQHLCGKVDVYFCGHDHDLQWLQPACGTEFVVSGGASDLRSTGQGDNPTFFQASKNGVLWVEVAGDTLTGVFYDESATELFRRQITR
jgi:hypothetical protein